jgi:RecA-family ATPase
MALQGYRDGQEPHEQQIHNERSSEGSLMAKFKFTQARDITLELEPGLIDGLLEKVGISVMYGPSFTGKTFLAVDLACRVAAGGKWYGMDVEQGPVAYLAAESPGSTRRRIFAWKAHHNVGDDLPLYLLENSFCLSGRGDGVQRLSDARELVRDMKLIKPVLIVVDTLARSMRDDENSNEAMGAYIAACETLRNAFNCQVLIVHHTGKDASRGSRGGSALKAAVDTEIELDKELKATVGCFKITKSRDGELAGHEFGYDLHKVHLGENSKGRNVSTCVIEEADAPEKKPKKAQIGGNALIVKQVFEANQKGGMLSMHRWSDLSHPRLDVVRKDKTFRGAAAKLHEKGIVYNDGTTAYSFATWLTKEAN